MNVTNEALRGAAFHEAGHVVVARAFGLKVGAIEIGEDGSGKAEISSAEHLPLVDQIALCVAGIEAQELFNCPTHEYAAFADFAKVCTLVEGLTDSESFEIRSAAYVRALDILKRCVPEVEQLAKELIEHGPAQGDQ
jgi:hypothetical protein